MVTRLRERIRDPRWFLGPSLALYLPLWKKDSTSFMSEDRYSHLATVTGVLWRPDGRAFDGEDYIAVGGTPAETPILAPTKDISVGLWFKDAGLGNYDILVANTNGDNLSVGYKLYFLSNTLRFVGNNYSSYYGSIAFVPDAKWHHIVGILYYSGENDGIARIYLDGVKGTDSGASNANLDYTGAVGLTLASAVRGAGAYKFNGIIGEARIYNRALTPLEIQHNYQITKWRY